MANGDEFIARDSKFSSILEKVNTMSEESFVMHARSRKTREFLFWSKYRMQMVAVSSVLVTAPFKQIGLLLFYYVIL